MNLLIELMEELFGRDPDGADAESRRSSARSRRLSGRKAGSRRQAPSEGSCASFAVSRTALREALRRLSARGLISVRKTAMYVSEIKTEDAIKSLNLYYDLRVTPTSSARSSKCGVSSSRKSPGWLHVTIPARIWPYSGRISLNWSTVILTIPKGGGPDQPVPYEPFQGDR